MKAKREVVTHQFCKTELRAILHILNTDDLVNTEELPVLGFETIRYSDDNDVSSFPLMYWREFGVCTESDILHGFSNPHQIEILSPFETPKSAEQIKTELLESRDRRKAEKDRATARKVAENHARGKRMLDQGYDASQIAKELKVNVDSVQKWISEGAPVEVTAG
jgi:hypothetical protein